MVALALHLVTPMPAGAESTDAAAGDELTAAAFDDSWDDSWSLTTGQQRLVIGLGVTVGMLVLAALAASCVTWLAERGPTAGPAPLPDIAPRDTPARRPPA